MKASDLEVAGGIVRALRKYRAMEEMVTGHPRRDGYLDIGDKTIALTHAQVDELLAAELQRISDAAAAIGLELEE